MSECFLFPLSVRLASKLSCYSVFCLQGSGKRFAAFGSCVFAQPVVLIKISFHGSQSLDTFPQPRCPAAVLGQVACVSVQTQEVLEWCYGLAAQKPGVFLPGAEDVGGSWKRELQSRSKAPSPLSVAGSTREMIPARSTNPRVLD